ncbi:MAG: stage II sporulation protein D [Bacillota bacterium]|nr:stage II sporulation protein D [Bacillota bacterium]
MKPFNLLFALAAILIAVTLVVPALMVMPFKGEKKGLDPSFEPKNSVPAVTTTNADSGVEVAVYRLAKSKVEKIPLEDYLVGVVAAEMPAEFEEEALKAQALTARTYIVKRLLTKDDSRGLPKGAEVTDTIYHQVYKSDDELKRIWGADYNWKKQKIVDAVRSTSGQILTYHNQAITATFFSTSNGYTENSEDYWPNAFPYLRSVKSPWDKNSPKFKSQKILTVTDFEHKLGIKLKNGSSIGRIVNRTAGRRVGKVDFNGRVLTGKEIRDELDLKSSDFTWERMGDHILIVTKGYGHGVGMSQYGANGMASEGKTYQDIVKYYYKGVQISSAENMLATITAKK